MGTLYLVSTPIGNMDDITIRAIKTLFSVDFIACEDTRKTGQLLATLEQRIINKELVIKELENHKKPKLISYYDEIEYKRAQEIIDLLQDNKNVALVSDSGTPLISDPGYKLVKECQKNKVKVISIPGPSSLISALTISGFPPNDFRFIGYLPSNRTKRLLLLNNIFNDLQHSRKLYTIIVFEVPHRLKDSLEDLKNIFGDIEIVICRELTKIHEEVWRGKITKSNDYYIKIKGELIILF